MVAVGNMSLLSTAEATAVGDLQFDVDDFIFISTMQIFAEFEKEVDPLIRKVMGIDWKKQCLECLGRIMKNEL